MHEQRQFDFAAASVVEASEVDALALYLLNRGAEWTTAKEIQAALGFNDRKVRKLKSLSRNRIVSAPGCPGYKHFQHCTVAEINEAAARRLSQIRAMGSEYIGLRKLAHSLIH